MIWHLLKCFDGEWSGWHLCSECYGDEGPRLRTVAQATKNNAYGQDPQRLVDPGRWYEFDEDEIAGTRLWELSCYECGEYLANDDVLRDEVPDLAMAGDIVFEAPAEPQPQLKYFANVPPMDPDEKPKTKKKSSTSTWDVMFDQAMAAQNARIIADPGPDF